MKCHYLDITLDEGKELVGVKTIGDTVRIIYTIENEIRPIGFVRYQDEENVDVGGDKGKTSKHIPVVAE